MTKTRFADAMNEIEHVGSRLEKERLLANLDKHDQHLLMWALDPAITFGITVKSKNNFISVQLDQSCHDDFWNHIDYLCERLFKRELTGNAAEAEVNNIISKAPSANDRKWAERLLNKNLRCGIQVTTVNKVFPGLIKPFAVSLAKPYDPAKHELNGRWIVEPKLDGLRMIVVDGVAYTRNGRVIETVGHILDELGSSFFDHWVLDGELMGAGDFDEASGTMRRKGGITNYDIYYNVFDIIDKNDWSRQETAPLWLRKENLLKEIKPSKHIRIVQWHELPEDPTPKMLFDDFRDKMIEDGYEGAMLKNIDAQYHFERSDDLLKLKDFTDDDCIVTDWYEGKGRHKGRLGGIVVELDGIKTKVGSGFSDKQRDELWTRRASLAGMVAEVQYQNKTSGGSLRFPVFIKFRQDKE